MTLKEGFEKVENFLLTIKNLFTGNYDELKGSKMEKIANVFHFRIILAFITSIFGFLLTNSFIGAFAFLGATLSLAVHDCISSALKEKAKEFDENNIQEEAKVETVEISEDEEPEVQIVYVPTVEQTQTTEAVQEDVMRRTLNKNKR